MDSNQSGSNKKNNFPGDKKLFKCRICKKIVLTKNDFNSHAMEHKNTQCEICFKTIARSGLARHKKIHSGVKPYECEICSKIFAQKSHLERHITLHTGEKPFQCDICSKAFKRKHHLDYHKRIHNRDRKFNCNVCANEFISLPEIKIHMLKHNGKKSHKCNVCSKEFLTSWHYRQHLEIHDKKLKCLVCSKLFALVYSLNKHKKKCISPVGSAIENQTNSHDHPLKELQSENENQMKRTKVNASAKDINTKHINNNNNNNNNNSGGQLCATDSFDQMECKIGIENIHSESMRQQILAQRNETELDKELLERKPELDVIYNDNQHNLITIKQELNNDFEFDNIPLNFIDQNYELESILDVMKTELQR